MKHCNGPSHPAGGADLPVEMFAKDTPKRDGLGAWCRECHAAKNKIWREANREHKAATFKAWYEANREHKATTNKAWKETNRERAAATSKAWYEAKADQIITELHAAESEQERAAVVAKWAMKHSNVLRFSRVKAVIRQYSLKPAETILRDQIVSTYERLKDNTWHRWIFTTLLTLAMGAVGGSKIEAVLYKSDDAEEHYANAMEEIEMEAFADQSSLTTIEPSCGSATVRTS